eukprot:SAG11_NODE_15344_length_581_cov_1.147303_1_plen_138_part_01
MLLNDPVTNPLSLSPGAGTSSWFCASNGATRLAATEAATRYSRLKDQIPHDRSIFTKHLSGNESFCALECDADSACVGFTTAGEQCWMYNHVTCLIFSKAADFMQKPGTPQLYARTADQAPAGGNAAANSSMLHGALD